MKYLIYFILFATIISCTSKEVYNKTYTIGEVWTYNDSLVYDYTIQDTLIPYNLFLTITHGKDYKYENLYVNASTLFPDGRRTSYPVSLELADDHGQWVGQCSGSECTTEIGMANNAYFQKPGKYQLVLKQFSRTDTLSGIRSLQLQIVQSDIKK